ncbi:LexA family protein [Streptomyces gibsoniae]|uniref:LexA repressor DNA-binding domain-containing protein n=1 Tax=Streptomyces gibsoniae TaxID=3075529 RepID=A0ABU2U963_9ACTN|nr:hypothetical protein [Streptomyces sp. DSM 41699]MDT0469775.1 hypothetical protein [Streptomyces sp. DSM 41699]
MQSDRASGVGPRLAPARSRDVVILQRRATGEPRPGQRMATDPLDCRLPRHDRHDPRPHESITRLHVDLPQNSNTRSNSGIANHRIDYLTSTQEQILCCIRESIGEHGEAPTVQEIGDELGLRSRATVHYHLRRIEALGCIARERYRPRGIRLT